MSGGSIRLRLWSAAAISIVVALGLAGIGLRFLFERHVERRIASDLTVELNQLVAATAFDSDGRLAVTPGLADPRFAVPLSGLYWQVEEIDGGGAVIRSRSLWDTTLAPTRRIGERGGVRVAELTGPGGALLVAAARTITDAGGRSFRAIVAEDHRAVEVSVDEYVSELAPALILLALVLIAAIFTQVTIGLAPLESLRAALSEVVGRRAARLEVDAPKEVRPLVDEINRLLAAQEKALKRARSAATDLAHGLKTPLQVISGEIRALRTKGEADLAGEIEKSLGAIRRHIDRELARARVAPGVAVGECAVAEVAARVVDVVRRTPGGRRLAIEVNVAPAVTASIDEDDLAEILGNLVENAARFARARLTVSAESTTEGTTIAVGDDGPGIPEEARQAALARGVRLDTAGSGTGLGLAIVADIADAYGGRVTLADAGPGLSVSVFLPRPAAAAVSA
ncbi:MAG TPA: HAMP domain-containing sensor histidine kinase [Bauldia sp.]|nr:HAMP domain-containing sensor histidine kinase [Bauldia sp.]